jgi:hypothetical protein
MTPFPERAELQIGPITHERVPEKPLRRWTSTRVGQICLKTMMFATPRNLSLSSVSLVVAHVSCFDQQGEHRAAEPIEVLVQVVWMIPSDPELATRHALVTAALVFFRTRAL